MQRSHVNMYESQDVVCGLASQNPSTPGFKTGDQIANGQQR